MNLISSDMRELLRLSTFSRGYECQDICIFDGFSQHSLEMTVGTAVVMLLLRLHNRHFRFSLIESLSPCQLFTSLGQVCSRVSKIKMWRLAQRTDFVLPSSPAKGSGPACHDHVCRLNPPLDVPANTEHVEKSILPLL